MAPLAIDDPRFTCDQPVTFERGESRITCGRSTGAG